MIELVASNSQNRYNIFSQQLLQESFPLCERPSLDDLRQRDNALFHACTILNEGEAAGLFNYWEFPDFLYIEHFAIDPNLRNNGIGAQTLQQFSQKSNHTIVLEAELPTNEIAERRIQFYQRNGFIVNPQPYIQPAYRPQGETLEMSILSTKQLDDNQFEKVKTTLYRHVYKQPII